MKVIIEDLVAKHSGGQETELPEDTAICFEVSKGDFITVQMTDDGLLIRKVGEITDQIKITPLYSNRIIIK